VIYFGRGRSRCNLSLVVESDDTQRTQRTHNPAGHIRCDMAERLLFQEEQSTVSLPFSVLRLLARAAFGRSLKLKTRN
jgi:hypothetical protein